MTLTELKRELAFEKSLLSWMEEHYILDLVQEKMIILSKLITWELEKAIKARTILDRTHKS
jgi:hypothetical protein